MKLSKAKKIELYKQMLKIRAFEEKAAELYENNLIPGFIHLSIGQEASSVGVCSVLRHNDYVATTHRGHGHMLAKGADPEAMFAELFGRRSGYCKGKGGSMHIADFSSGILGANGVVGGGFPIIIGAGLSIKLRRTDQVAVVFFGDGAANRGTFHEACNMAAIWSLPIIFVCENNQYASTTPSHYALAGGSVAKRGCAYGIPGHQVDGNDVLRVREVAAKAVQRARSGKGPTIVENNTYRFRGHYEGDPQKYRSPEEVGRIISSRDPIRVFETRLKRERVLGASEIERIRAKISEAIQRAAEKALEAPLPDPEEALDDLFVTP